ncbi:MAG: N-acetylmuramoyl-L-alanine amidase family protein [Eubacteriales bacterium]
MIRDPQAPKSYILTDVMSGRNGTLIVIIVIIFSLIAVSCAVFAAWQVHNAAMAAGAYVTDIADGTENRPESEADTTPVTDETVKTETTTPQTEAPQTEAPQTEPPQTEAPETEPPETEPPEPDKNVIIIDAGHGYDDPGTDADILGSWSEKDITLDIALRLGAILEAEGCEVFYTRKDDIIPKNAPRNAEGFYLLNAYAREDFIKSQKNVDAFVSVHCDSYEQDPKINGVRIFYYKYNSTNIEKLAGDIAAGIENALKIKGKPGTTPPLISGLSKEEAFYVTKCTSIPSVLVETGFVTNKTDVNNFLNTDWRQDMAQGIADGVLSFLQPK